MSAFRIAVAGSSGSLGREIIRVLEERRFPVEVLVPFATDRSLGEEVEFAGDVVPIEAEMPPLRGLDLLIIATPPTPALDLVREALRAQVPCIDCSGAMAASSEVPLYVADITPPKLVREAPLAAIPASVALSWAHVLAAFEGSAGLKRVVGTVVLSASSAGRRGIEALSSETLRLLGQQSLPESDVFPQQVAFDCFPEPGTGGEDLAGAQEVALRSDIQRLIAPELPVAIGAVQIPVFSGEGSSIAVETTLALNPERASEIFHKAPGLELWGEDDAGPSTRDASGRDVVLVGRVRRDPSHENGLLLWLVADGLRLAAVNAVRLAETRLDLA